MKALGVLCVLAFASVAAADIESGLKAGEKVPALKAFGLVGATENKETDFAADRKDEPTVYLFVQSEHFSRPMARFLNELDGKIGVAGEKAAAVAVWVGDKSFEKDKDRIPKIHTSLKFEKTAIAAFEGEKSGPNGWGVNPDAHLTVIVVNKGKVVKSFAFTVVNDTDVPAVLKELQKK